MSDSTSEASSVNTSLEAKYRAFLESLSDDELALYGQSLGVEEAEVSGFSLGRYDAGSSLPVLSLGTIFQDVTVNKAKTADKAFQAMDKLIRG